MQVNITQADKDDMELTLDNSTIAELLRVYLNEHGVKFAAWRREHPSKPVVMRIQTSSGTVKKAVSDAVAALQKELDALTAGLKKK